MEATPYGWSEWDEPKFSPDGKWIVALTPNRLRPPQIQLHPNGPGETRQLTSPPASHSAPFLCEARERFCSFGSRAIRGDLAYGNRRNGRPPVGGGV